ncbi:MAG: hypothetical protein AAGA73_01255 [Pseudomonadota bacterium]
MMPREVDENDPRHGIGCAQHQCHAVIGHRKSRDLMNIISTLPEPYLPLPVMSDITGEEADGAALRQRSTP